MVRAVLPSAETRLVPNPEPVTGDSAPAPERCGSLVRLPRLESGRSVRWTYLTPQVTGGRLPRPNGSAVTGWSARRGPVPGVGADLFLPAVLMASARPEASCLMLRVVRWCCAAGAIPLWLPSASGPVLPRGCPRPRRPSGGTAVRCRRARVRAVMRGRRLPGSSSPGPAAGR